jgi:ectoine hydroxylase-related dioxygenase (phytanoyl-CoA dioxygenase family)
MAEDLALRHGPVGDLFPRAGPDESRFRLSEAQVAHYREHGYVAGVRVLDERQVEALRAELEAFFAPEHEGRELWYEYRANASTEPGRRLLHAVGAWRLRPGFHDLLWHPAVTVPLAQLLDGPIRLLHDQLFCKPARSGGIVAWHQDYSYWTYAQPMAHATCWIALDDADEGNGCLHYVPGSQRWGLLPITGLTEDHASIHEVLTPAQEAAFKPVPVPLPRGYAAFHHPLMVHGSHPNGSDRPRRATVVNVMRDGARAAVDEPTIGGVPAWLLGTTETVPFYPLDPEPKGPLLDGPYFPLL